MQSTKNISILNTFARNATNGHVGVRIEHASLSSLPGRWELLLWNSKDRHCLLRGRSRDVCFLVCLDLNHNHSFSCEFRTSFPPSFRQGGLYSYDSYIILFFSFFFSSLNQCHSYCSVTVRRHQDPGNSLKKAFNQGLACRFRALETAFRDCVCV